MTLRLMSLLNHNWWRDARYEHLFGKDQRPHPSREPSVEQLTAIHGLIRSDQNPYVDFAIFGPFATRLKKRLKFQGLILSKDGERIQTELHGPQNFATWKASFEVYYNALIMVDAVDLGSVLDYSLLTGLRMEPLQDFWFTRI